MIINKIDGSYWKQEEKEKLKELEHEKARLYSVARGADTETFNDAMEKIRQIEENLLSIQWDIYERYAATRKPKGLLEDIEEIVSNITKEDYLADIAQKNKTIAELAKREGANPTIDETLKLLRGMAEENYENCYDFILKRISIQIRFLYDDVDRIAKAEALIKGRVSLWYGKPHYIRQGTVSNALTKMKAKKQNTVIDYMGTATITSGDFQLVMPEFTNQKAPKATTYQLLDALTVKLTETGAKSPTVIMPLDEYMTLRHMKDRKEARKQVDDGLEALFSERLSGKEKRGKEQEKAFFDMRIIDFKGIDRKGNITVIFGTAYFNLLKNYPIMYYPPQLWLLNSKRNPNSYYLLRKIAELKNMNIGKKNENIVAVKTLLANTPDIPSYEEVMSGNRNVQDRIIDPFKRDMDALAETLTWEYCHANGEPLKQEELDNLNYDTFIGLMIKTAWAYYPDQTARLERKAERIEQAKTTRKRAPKKKAEV